MTTSLKAVYAFGIFILGKSELQFWHLQVARVKVSETEPCKDEDLSECFSALGVMLRGSMRGVRGTQDISSLELDLRWFPIASAFRNQQKSKCSLEEDNINIILSLEAFL